MRKYYIFIMSQFAGFLVDKNKKVVESIDAEHDQPFYFRTKKEAKAFSESENLKNIGEVWIFKGNIV